jgi:hypothetical protein
LIYNINTFFEAINMTLTEIIPSLKQLSSQEKLKAIQFLAAELVQENIAYIEPNKSYEIWSPYKAFSAGRKNFNSNVRRT